MPFNIPHLEVLRERDQELYEALRTVQEGISTGFSQVNVDPSRPAVGAPEQIAGLNVTEANGIHDIQITDNSKAYRQINYFAEYSQTPDFKNAHQIDLGSSQNHRANLGAGKYYWRASSAYPTSDPSAHVYHGGTAPLAVGSGAYAGPAMSLRQGGVGFGPQYRNSTTAPRRS